MTAQQEHFLEPVKKKVRLYEEVVQQIIAKIESGVLVPGDRLPTERDLVKQLGVSRTSVREALRALELMGMIESKVKEGTFVSNTGLDAALIRYAKTTKLNDRRTLEMYQVRAQLEALSIALAAKNRNKEHLETMRKAIDGMKEEIAMGTRGLDSDKQFHRTIAEAAGNSILNEMLVMCSGILQSSINTSNAHANVNVLVSEHQEMYDAVKKRDAKLAEKLMREHIQRAYDRTKFIVDKDE